MDATSSAAKRGRPAVAGPAGTLPQSNPVIALGTGRAALHDFALAAGEVERFLRIVSRASGVRRHYELFQLLQGEVQYFIAHQILISAWGDFRGPDLEFDVISALPGVRTTCLEYCDIDRQVKGLHARWVAHGRQPLLLDNAAGQATGLPECECPLHRSLKSMLSVMVHGVHDARDGTDSLYLAASERPIERAHSIERYLLRIDTIICQLDVAFRRVAQLKSRAQIAAEKSPSGRNTLSGREEEILAWVSAGRTNREISRILAISAFTVKNHVQRIIKKLGAANRTEAVAKHRQIATPAHKRLASGSGRAAERREAALAAE